MDGWLEEQETVLTLCTSLGMNSLLAILGGLSSRVTARFLRVVERLVFRA